MVLSFKDTVMQEEFEEAFPFTETPGQLKAIEDVKEIWSQVKLWIDLSVEMLVMVRQRSL